MVKMLIDVDTGIDDSIALLYALNHPEVEVLGITTACGNVDAMQAAENTVRIVELSGTKAEVPVVIGANQPLNGKWNGAVEVIHGENGIGNVELPKTDRKPRTDISAEDFIYETACKQEGELVLVTLGRLTNIALALKKYPELTKKVKKVVMMGGTVNECGNVSPVVEANFGGDPEACDFVFQSGMDITVVGLDVTMKVRLKMEHIETLKKYCSKHCEPAVVYMEKALRYYMKGNRIQNFCMDDCPLHDPLAMMSAVVPSLIMTQERKARIECGGTYCRGMVVTDLREYPIEAQYVKFALDVDPRRAINELMSVFWMDQFD